MDKVESVWFKYGGDRRSLGGGSTQESRFSRFPIKLWSSFLMIVSTVDVGWFSCQTGMPRTVLPRPVTALSVVKKEVIIRERIDASALASCSFTRLHCFIRLETKSCRISYGKLMVKYDRT